MVTKGGTYLCSTWLYCHSSLSPAPPLPLPPVRQLLEYKQKWSEAQAELQQSLKASKKEVKETVEEKRRIEEELRELSDGVEMATLDKEMAEERVCRGGEVCVREGIGGVRGGNRSVREGDGYVGIGDAGGWE